MSDNTNDIFKGKKILVCDDDADMADVIASQLSELNCSVAVAKSGVEALEKMKDFPIDLLISDIQMPGMSGLELLRTVKKGNPKTIVLLITGDRTPTESVDFVLAGCRAIIDKPFDQEDLVAAVKDSLTTVTWSQFDLSKYLAISIDNFMGSPSIRYPLFVRLPDERFLRIANVGDYIPRERFDRLKTKKIFDLWISKENFDDYKSRYFEVKDSDDPQIGERAKSDNQVRLALACQEVAAESLRMMGVDEKNAGMAAEMVKTSVDFLLKADSGAEVSRLIERISTVDLFHGVACSALLSHLTRLMGWNSKKTVQTTILAAFLHDIGLQLIPEKLRKMEHSQLAGADREVYESHVQKGHDLVSKIPNLPSEVASIILQHHEDGKGTGYPNGLRQSEILPLTRLICLIDLFVQEISKIPAERRQDEALAVLNNLAETCSPPISQMDVRTLRITLEEPDFKKARLTYLTENRR